MSVGQSIGRSLCHHFVLAYRLVTRGGSGRLCVTLGNSWVTLNDSGSLWVTLGGSEDTSIVWLLALFLSHTSCLISGTHAHLVTTRGCTKAIFYTYLKAEIWVGTPLGHEGLKWQKMANKFFLIFLFLVACKQIYKRLCRSVRNFIVNFWASLPQPNHTWLMVVYPALFSI